MDLIVYDIDQSDAGLNPVLELVPKLFSPFQFFTVPLEILEEIFLNLPHPQVVCVCRLVCRQWKEVADSESLWRERCRREGYHLRDASKTPSDWRLFYFLCKKRRNLIKNPRGDSKRPEESFFALVCLQLIRISFILLPVDEMKFWEIVANGGDRWSAEGLLFPHPNETVQNNFVTSYQ